MSQRVLWPAPPATRFECADYFRPQERLNAEQMTLLIDFLAKDKPQGYEVRALHHAVSAFVAVL